MIFVTVGTHHQPFQRLLDGLADLDGSELTVQYGPGNPPAGVEKAVAYMSFEEMLEQLARADRVITHAGVGSILCARREGHLPVVVPRRHELGEHVDEHQAELTRALAERASVIPVWDMADLAALTAKAPAKVERRAVVDPLLAGHVRSALLDRGAQASRE